MTCTAHIGRMQAIGIGKETTAGTQVSATDRLAKTSGLLKPVIETLKDTAWYGVIDTVYDVQTVKEHTETNIEWTITDDSFGLLLLWALGTVAKSWSWPYTHAFTRSNTNCHPSFSIRGVDPVGTVASTYSMVQSLNISVEAEDYATFSCNMLGKKGTSESAPTVSYASETLFRAKDCKVYFASTEWGLAGATAISVNSVNLNIEKNLMVHQSVWSVDIDKIFNQNFDVSGDFEAIFSNTDYQVIARDGTKQYIKIEFINPDVDLAVSGNPTLSFTFAKVAFESWDSSDDNDAIVTQTVGFVASYNNTDGYSVKATMINDNATGY